MKCKESDSIINVDYEDFTNSVEVSIGNKTGFRFVNLNFEQCEKLSCILSEVKNQIV